MTKILCTLALVVLTWTSPEPPPNRDGLFETLRDYQRRLREIRPPFAESGNLWAVTSHTANQLEHELTEPFDAGDMRLKLRMIDIAVRQLELLSVLRRGSPGDACVCCGRVRLGQLGQGGGR